MQTLLLAPIAAGLAASSVWAGYLALLCVLAESRRGPGLPLPVDADPGFLVLIPAHNESGTIGPTVEAISARMAGAAIPARIVVIADNCSDSTAEEAGSAGAEVLERANPRERGKGYALKFAQSILETRNDWRILVVMDADARPADGFFRELELVFAAGAPAVQPHDAVSAAGRSWRQELQRLAWGVFNYARPSGRGRIGGTAPILGNGFAIRREVLAAVPFGPTSQVEAVEHGLDLLERGYRVMFAPAARLDAPAEGSARTATSQRVRWERGRMTLAAKWIPRLLGSRSSATSWQRVEAVLDLSLPPLVPFAALVTLLGMAGWLAGGAVMALWAVDILALVAASTIVAAAKSGVPARSFLGLAGLPVFLAWKVALYLKPPFWTEARWVRTESTLPVPTGDKVLCG